MDASVVRELFYAPSILSSWRKHMFYEQRNPITETLSLRNLQRRRREGFSNPGFGKSDEEGFSNHRQRLPERF
jgi:hypothetical protein